MLVTSLLALLHGGPNDPHSLLLARSTTCAFATRLAQLSGMLPDSRLFAKDRKRSAVLLLPHSGLKLPADARGEHTVHGGCITQVNSHIMAAAAPAAHIHTNTVHQTRNAQ